MASLRPTRKIWEYSYGPQASLEEFDPLSVFFMMGPEFIKQARSTREREAVSYRGVLVGACALVTDTQRHRTGAYIGFNNTPRRGAPKHCAEMRALGRAMSSGYSQQEAVIVAGPTDPKVIESITGRSTPTLPPCEPCTDIIQDAAVVLTVGEEANTAQAWTGAQLKQIYTPTTAVTRRRRAEDRLNKPLPGAFEIPIDHMAEYWHHAGEAYETSSAGIQADSNRQLRMMRAQAAIEALYSAAG